MALDLLVQPVRVYDVPTSVDLANHADGPDIFQICIEKDASLKEVSERVSLEDIQAAATAALAEMKVETKVPEDEKQLNAIREFLLKDYMHKIELERETLRGARLDEADDHSFNHWYAMHKVEHAEHLRTKFREEMESYAEFLRRKKLLMDSVQGSNGKVKHVQFEVPPQFTRHHGWTDKLPGQRRPVIVSEIVKSQESLDPVNSIGITADQNSQWWLRGWPRWFARWTRMDANKEGWSSTLYRNSYAPWRMVLFPPATKRPPPIPRALVEQPFKLEIGTSVWGIPTRQRD